MNKAPTRFIFVGPLLGVIVGLAIFVGINAPDQLTIVAGVILGLACAFAIDAVARRSGSQVPRKDALRRQHNVRILYLCIATVGFSMACLGAWILLTSTGLLYAFFSTLVVLFVAYILAFLAGLKALGDSPFR